MLPAPTSQTGTHKAQPERLRPEEATLKPAELWQGGN